MNRADCWIFRRACGCAFGLADADRRHPTLSAAWRAMYPRVRERDTAMDAGVTVERVPFAQMGPVYDQLKGDYVCPHQPA